MYSDVISGRQAVCILSVFLIGSAGITLGSRRAGAMSWLALLCGTAAGLLLLWGLSWIIQKQQYRNLFELSRNCCGSVVGNTITVTLILYAILRGVCSVRAFCDMVSVTALPDTPVLFTALCVCAVAAILMKSGLHVTGKCSLVFIILIVLSVAATALLATANMDLTQLMVPAAPANVALDAIDYFTHPFCDAILVLCTFSRIKSGQNRWKLLLGGGALAAGVFALIVIENVEGMGIRGERSIVKYTLLAGLLAAVGLAVVYGILAYVGATSSPLGQFENGGQLLSAVANHMFGTVGMLILGVAVLFACLTTAIGLTTSFGDYFSRTYIKLEYNHVIIAVCVFSFLVSNVGLSQLISITLPVLLMVYPLLMALVFTAFLDKLFQGRQAVYVGVLLGTAIISIPNGLEALAANYGMNLGIVSQWLTYVPFYELSLGWVIPAVLGGVIGWIVSLATKRI